MKSKVKIVTYSQYLHRSQVLPLFMAEAKREAAKVSETAANTYSNDSFFWFERNSTIFVLLHEDNTVIGFIGLMTMPFMGSSGICALYVVPEHRGKGYAKLLVKEAERQMRQWQKSYDLPDFSSCLGCFDECLPFWEKMGYHVVEKRKLDNMMVKTW